MSYIENVLMPNEKIEKQAQLSIWAFLPRLLLGMVFVIIAFSVNVLAITLIALLIWVSAYLEYISTELALTNKRIIAKFGFIKRSTVELNLSKVESIQVDQGILGRIFNFGSIIISGAGNPQAPIPYISEPIQFRNSVVSVQEKTNDSESEK